MTSIVIENAKIHTATIEIKTLTIKDKQITLSVFRQIPYEDIIDGSNIYLNLNGTPWGTVNYYWGEDKDKSSLNYHHVVWQKDDDLKRCIIPKMWSHSVLWQRLVQHEKLIIQKEPLKEEEYKSLMSESYKRLEDLTKSFDELPQLYIAI